MADVIDAPDAAVRFEVLRRELGMDLDEFGGFILGAGAQILRDSGYSDEMIHRVVDYGLAAITRGMEESPKSS